MITEAEARSQVEELCAQHRGHTCPTCADACWIPERAWLVSTAAAIARTAGLDPNAVLPKPHLSVPLLAQLGVDWVTNTYHPSFRFHGVEFCTYVYREESAEVVK